MDLDEAVAGAAVVVVCTPVDRVVEDLRLAARAAYLAEPLNSSVLLTDAGSSKRRIVEAVEADSSIAGFFAGALRWPDRNVPAWKTRGPTCSRVGCASWRQRFARRLTDCGGHMNSGQASAAGSCG